MAGFFPKFPTNIVFFFFLILTIIFIATSQATLIQILNNCPYTVWAAANPGGGKKLNHGEIWNLIVARNATGRIWGRTNCAFGPDGRGNCESGDCGGHLECEIDGRAPNTIAIYLLNQPLVDDTDLFYVSVVEGFNIPMEFGPSSETSVAACAKSKCTADVNEACPMELRDPGGCNNPCTVFGNDQFCCLSGSICEPTSYSIFFRELCPEANTYPSDISQRRACPTGTDYTAVFCPSRSRRNTNSSGKNFIIRNDCPYTVWAAAIPGGGMRLLPGESWSVSMAPGTTGGRVWPRTGCKFDDSGGKCQTGDCGGVLQCQGYGQPPNTLAEFALNQFNNLDFFDISLVDGFNVPMKFSPTSRGCTRGINCTGDINGQCPNELRAPGGCNNPCTVFKTNEYCCDSSSCGPTSFSRFFKQRCPDVYSYPKDDSTSTFTCPSGTNYKVVFCP